MKSETKIESKTLQLGLLAIGVLGVYLAFRPKKGLSIRIRQIYWDKKNVYYEVLNDGDKYEAAAPRVFNIDLLNGVKSSAEDRKFRFHFLEEIISEEKNTVILMLKEVHDIELPGGKYDVGIKVKQALEVNFNTRKVTDITKEVTAINRQINEN